MSTRNADDDGNGGGGGSGGVCCSCQDNSAFPRFQPMVAARQHQPPRQCSRTHTIQQPTDNGQSEGRQIHCSAHPNEGACCSARPTVINGGRRQNYCGKGRRLYRPPLANCERFLPLTSLSDIYKQPENVSDGDSEGVGASGGTPGAPTAGDTAGSEEGEQDLTATHSCPLSSASPEARPRCCRRPGGQPQHLEILLQDTRPTNANHIETAAEERERRVVIKAKSEAQRKQSKSKVPPYESSPPSSPSKQNQEQQKQQQREQKLRQEQQQKQQPKQQHQKQQLPKRQSTVVETVTAPERVSRAPQLRQPPMARVPPNHQQYGHQQGDWKCQHERSMHYQPGMQYNQHPLYHQNLQQKQLPQHQQPQQHNPTQHEFKELFGAKLLRSYSLPASLCGENIYSESDVFCTRETTPPPVEQPQPQQQQQQQQQQHILRRSLSGLLRSRSGIVYRDNGHSSSATDY